VFYSSVPFSFLASSLPALLVLSLAAFSGAAPALAGSITLTGNYGGTDEFGDPLPVTPIDPLNTGDLTLGVTGQGGLDVESGGTASSFGAVTLGQNSGATGTAIVNGSGSSWSISTVTPSNLANLTIGKAGTGTLTIENGGLVNSGNVYFGASTGGQGDVTVTS